MGGSGGMGDMGVIPGNSGDTILNCSQVMPSVFSSGPSLVLRAFDALAGPLDLLVRRAKAQRTASHPSRIARGAVKARALILPKSGSQMTVLRGLMRKRTGRLAIALAQRVMAQA